jgi:hypothetical protein
MLCRPSRWGVEGGLFVRLLVVLGCGLVFQTYTR